MHDELKGVMLTKEKDLGKLQTKRLRSKSKNLIIVKDRDESETDKQLTNAFSKPYSLTTQNQSNKQTSHHPNARQN
jgi:hypothetical protein